MFKFYLKKIQYRRRRVIEKFGFEISSLLALTGANGSGKTSILKACCGQLKGPLYAEMDGHRLNKISLRRISSCSLIEARKIDTTLSIEHQEERLNQNPLYNAQELAEYLEDLELNNIKNTTINNLSAGEFDRLTIALTLAKNSKIYFLDEPTAHLDEKNKLVVAELLKRLSGKKTILITTNDKMIADSLPCLDLTSTKITPFKKAKKYLRIKDLRHVEQKKSILFDRFKFLQTASLSLATLAMIVGSFFYGDVVHSIVPPPQLEQMVAADLQNLVSLKKGAKAQLSDFAATFGLENLQPFYQSSVISFDWGSGDPVNYSLTQFKNIPTLKVSYRTPLEGESLPSDGYFLTSALAGLLGTGPIAQSLGINPENSYQKVKIGTTCAKGIVPGKDLAIVAKRNFIASNFNDSFKIFSIANPTSYRLDGTPWSGDLNEDEVIVPASQKDDSITISLYDSNRKLEVVGYHNLDSDTIYVSNSMDVFLNLLSQKRDIIAFDNLKIDSLEVVVNQYQPIKSNYLGQSSIRQKALAEYHSAIRKTYQIAGLIVGSMVLFYALVTFALTFISLKKNTKRYSEWVAEGRNKYRLVFFEENTVLFPALLGSLGIAYNALAFTENLLSYPGWLCLLLLSVIGILIFIIKLSVLVCGISNYPIQRLKSEAIHD